MPFLNEVFEQVSETSSPSHVFNTKKTKMVNYVNRVYATTEPAESGLLSTRKVPTEIVNQVPKYKLQVSQNQPPKLNKIEIGIEAQGSLINRCTSAIERMTQSLLDTEDPIELPISIQNQMGSLKTSLSLMKQTMFDLKSSKNDASAAGLRPI